MTQRRALIAVVVLGLLGVLANSAFEVSTFFRLHDAQRATTQLAKTALNQNKTIQRQRYDIAFSDCVDKNQRHDKTVQAFKNIPQPPVVERGRYKATILLLDAAVPHEDCLKVARLTLGSPGPPLPPPPGKLPHGKT